MKDARVPCAPITRLLREYIGQRQLEGLAAREVIIDLAEKVGVDDRNFLFRYLNGGNKTVDKGVADRILCLIDRVEEWRLDPELCAAYEAS